MDEKTQAKKSRVHSANPLWGGHYAKGPAAIMAEINASIDFDKRLYAEDIEASKAHAAMLAAKDHQPQGRARHRDGARPGKIRREIESGKFKFSRALEDASI